MGEILNEYENRLSHIHLYGQVGVCWSLCPPVSADNVIAHTLVRTSGSLLGLVSLTVSARTYKPLKGSKGILLVLLSVDPRLSITVGLLDKFDVIVIQMAVINWSLKVTPIGYV